MTEQLKFYKGFESDLPVDNIETGALYHCIDTGNTYRGTDANSLELFSSAAGKVAYDNNGNKNIIFDSDISYFQGNIYVNDTNLENKNTQKVATEQYVKDLLGIQEEFSVTDELVKLDLDIEAGTGLQVVSKIHRDETWGESNKLVLHQVSGDNFVDLSSFLGGVGKVYETSGVTTTVNADSTITITGTNSSTSLIKAFKVSNNNTKVYPAGTYIIPAGLIIQIRAAQYPTYVPITGLTGNLSKKIVVPQPFRVVTCYTTVAGGATVNKTIPLGFFRTDSIPETGYEYVGNLYTATFDRNVYDGEYNWTTGELKDADGNTIAYYESQTISKLPGVNYFWTGFGEVTVSNLSTNDLEKVVIRLGESAPEETISSICDFTLTPTTPQASYCLHSNKVTPGGTKQFLGHEIPLITTKGTLMVVDAQGEVTTEKYINSLINWQGATDILTNQGIHKVWSEKFYFTKEPVAQEDFSYGAASNSLYTFEFTEEDFQNTGLPAKLDNIPIVSPCFYTGADAASKLTSRVWGDGIFPATLSWDSASEKYIFKVRGLHSGSIMAQLQMYTKCYLHYQLETPYDIATTVALGLSSGDMVTFTVDDSDWKTYLDAGLYKDSNSNNITEVDTIPTGFVYIPRNAVDACDGMINAARMLNNAGSAGGDATVQGYSWIGEGDGITDYTAKIQNKLDIIHQTSNGGTIYLGPGTYRISNNLLIYDNTRIIGDGQTIIEQIADNTHVFVLCGSGITIENLSIKLSGKCTTITACIYINSNNNPSGDNYNSAFPETRYVQRLTVDNVFMSGKYKFDNQNGHQVISNAYENYFGVGIYSHRLFFNYAHIDNVHFKYLHAGVYGGGGSNYYNIISEFNKYGLYINHAGDNTYFVGGHSYYGNDENGDYITMSDAIAYVDYDTMSTYHLRTYDTQAYKTIAFFGGRTSSNKIDIQFNISTQHGLWFSHSWNIMKWMVIDYGRANMFSNLFKNTPFHIGSADESISKGPYLELPNPVIQNALSGAGVWGNISSNIEFKNKGINLRDVCRYPSEKTVFSHNLPYIVSNTAPSADNPIEIIIDFSNRPIIGHPNYFIQFHHDYIASDYTVSFDTTNTGVFNEEFVIPVTGNTNITEFFDYPQIGHTYTTYRMKFSFTKALQINNLRESMRDNTFNYNPNGLIGICNIGMTVNDYAGRSFLGECGGSLYGNVDMHQNTLKNLPTPIDDGDAVSKAYIDEKLRAVETNKLILIDRITGKKYNLYLDNGNLVSEEEVE